MEYGREQHGRAMLCAIPKKDKLYCQNKTAAHQYYISQRA